MELDREHILALAKQVDPDNFESLTNLFLEMVEQEHHARHKSKPGITKKISEMVDQEGGYP